MVLHRNTYFIRDIFFQQGGGQKTSELTWQDHRLKLLIEKLKQKCLSKEEIEKIIILTKKSIRKDTLRKRRARDLEKLKYYGLVEERGDKYCWYLYPNWFETTNDRDAMVEHSKQLIPGLCELAGISYNRSNARSQPEKYLNPRDLEILTKCAEDHLIVPEYNDIYELLEETRLVDKREIQLRGTLESSILEALKKEYEEKVYFYEGKKPETFVGSNISSLICNHLIYGSRGVSLDLEIRDNKIKAHQGNITVAEGNIQRSKLDLFIKGQINEERNIHLAKQIDDLAVKKNKIHEGLEEEIRKLILRIEGDSPLHGRCDNCSDVVILSNNKIFR